MTASFTSDDLQALATFPFKDPRWKIKFLIGSLLMLAGYIIPLVPIIFIYGYCAQIMRHIIVENGEASLPEWDDWGKLFIDGLKLFGVTFIYSLPFIVLFCAGYGLFFATIIGSEAVFNTVPRDPDMVSPLAGIIPFVGMIIWMGSFGLGMVGAFAIGIVLPVAIGHLIATDDFAAAFRVREWWAIFRANLAGYLIAYVLLLGFYMVLSFAMQILYFTIILCCLVPFVLIFIAIYVMVIGSVLFAQAYQAGAEKLASQEVALQTL